MVRGLYTAASGALVAQTMIDITTNNLANVNTIGFKRSFLQVTANREIDVYRLQTEPGRNPGNRTQGVANVTPVGKLGLGSLIYDTPIDLDQGPIENTSNTYDFALKGPGYFVVQEQDGTVRYTRNGAFVRDGNGYLATENGDRVLGQNGPVQLPSDGAFVADRAGNMYVGTRFVDKLRMVEFRNPQNSRPEGANRATRADVIAPSTQTEAIQGHLERSNSDVVKSMVEIINGQRWFDANEKVISTEDTMLDEAITQVGRTGK